MSAKIMKRLGIVLSVVLLGALAGCGEAPDTGQPDSSASGNKSCRSRKGKAGDVKEAVDLAGLLTEIPEYAGRGRNLFDYGPLPVSDTPPRPTPKPTPPPPRTTRAAPPRTTAPARIDLKFAGYVETKTAAGTKKKYAVLLDGQEILTGAEGGLVANRYKIIQIGLESVTLGVPGSDQTQRIPLRSN